MFLGIFDGANSLHFCERAIPHRRRSFDQLPEMITNKNPMRTQFACLCGRTDPTENDRT